MSIHYFYNFCISSLDDTDLSSDILGAVRKSYFNSFDRINDKITVGSEECPLLYVYSIEKGKPMRWTVKDDKGVLLQEVTLSDDGRYYLCFYRDQKLYKRLLFSSLHTLLKAEYTDDDGAVCATIEPRKLQGGLCLLFESKNLSEPVVLSAVPSVDDLRVAEIVEKHFSGEGAVALTNDGVVRFLSDEQLAAYRKLVQSTEEELQNVTEDSFVEGDTPLFDKINARDFNVKRNLSSSLDISLAAVFGAPEEPVEEQNDEPVTEPVSEPVEDVPHELLEQIAEEAHEASEERESNISEPDKLIMADGAVYSYYGELDENGNRSGYGRTMTDLGKTAYEGYYLNDKRSGKGSYFYKDGTLCYSGDWSQNARHGIGIGVSARDGAMHIGRFKNNKPEGNGVRMTADGNILFVCKELGDGKTVLMHYLPDETVLITKYDEAGAKVSEKTVSLLDF